VATVYRFDVKCCSAFCAYKQEFIQKLIEDSLKSFVDKDTGLKLESI
jgi:hypothetical protein